MNKLDVDKKMIIEVIEKAESIGELFGSIEVIKFSILMARLTV